MSIGGGGSTGSSGSRDDTSSVTRDTDSECSELLLDGDIKAWAPADIADIPLYTHVSGYVSIGSGISNLDFLRCLETVDGRFLIHGTQLEGVEGLERLERVQELNVIDNQSLVSLEGLEALRVIEDYGLVDNNASMQLVGLRSLESIRELEIGHLCYSGNPSLTELGLDSLAEFGSVLIGNNPALTSIDSLSGLAARMQNAPMEIDEPRYDMRIYENESLPIEDVHGVLDEVYGDGDPVLLSCSNANEETCESMDPEWELKCLTGS